MAKKPKAKKSRKVSAFLASLADVSKAEVKDIVAAGGEGLFQTVSEGVRLASGMPNASGDERRRAAFSHVKENWKGEVRSRVISLIIEKAIRLLKI